MAEDNATTKANSIEWQTPALEGPIMGVVIDNTGKARYRAYEGVRHLRGRKGLG